MPSSSPCPQHSLNGLSPPKGQSSVFDVVFNTTASLEAFFCRRDSPPSDGKQVGSPAGQISSYACTDCAASNSMVMRSIAQDIFAKISCKPQRGYLETWIA